MTIVRHELSAGVEADIWIGYNQWVVCKPGIFGCIFHDQDIRLKEGVAAKRLVAGRFVRIEALAGFEPLPISINQGNQSNGRIEQRPRHDGDSVESLLNTRVEYLVTI